MTLLILTFLVLGSLLGLLVAADHQAGAAVETARVRTFQDR